MSELLCIDIIVANWDFHYTVMTEPLMLSDLASEGSHSFKVETVFATEMCGLGGVSFAADEW